MADLAHNPRPNARSPEPNSRESDAGEAALLAEIRALKKANRVLQKKLDRSQSDRLRLEETNEKKELLLRKIIQDRNKAEQQLQELIAGTATETGQDFFPALAHHISEVLDVAYVVVSEQIEDQLHPLAFWADGTLQSVEAYPLAKTPCERVLENGGFYCSQAVQQEFPEDQDLVDMGVDNYLGSALRDNWGNTMGTLCVLARQPLQDAQWAEQILRIFAARAAAELERQRAGVLLERLNQELEAQVTERTEALRSSEAQMRAMVEAIPDLLLRVTRDGTCLDYFQSHYQTGEFIPVQQHLSEVLPPDLLQQQLEAVEQAIATGTVQVYEQQFQKNGHPAYEEVRIGGLGTDEALVIVRDITNRKRAESALQESRQFLQTVLDTFPLSVFWKDRNSVYLGCNRNFMQDAGLASVEEVLGKTDYDMPWGNTEADDYRADDRQVVESNIPKLGIIETQIPADGNQIWLETNKLPLCNLEGEVIGVLGTYQDVSDRKRFEDALRESKQFIQTVLNTIPLPVFWKDRNSVFLGCNQRLAEAAGMQSPADLIGKTDYDLAVARDNAEQYQADDRQVIESGKAKLGIQETLLSPEGEQLWLETHKAPLRDFEGNIIGVVGAFQDITNRKQAEIRLRDSEQRFRSAIANAPLPTMIHAEDGEVLQINAAWTEFSGYTHAEIPTTQDWVQQAYGDQRLLDTVFAKKYTLDSRLDEGEFTITTKDGKQRIWSFSSSPLGLLPDGRQAAISMAADVTQRRQAELALQDSKERYRSIYSQTAVGLVNASLKGSFLEVNPRFCEMIGYSKAELQSKTIADITHPDDRSRIKPALESLFNGEVSYFFQEKRYLRKDGSTFWSITGVSLVRDSAGKPKNTLAVIQNITERKQAEAQVQSLLNRTQLLNRISTEIRNSLDLDLILQNSVNAIVAGLPADICTFAWYQDDATLHRWEIVKEQKAPELISWLGSYPLDGFPNLFEHIVNNQVYRVDGLDTLGDEALKVLLESNGILTFLCFPIHTVGGKVGSFQIGRVAADRPWQLDELDLLHDIGNQVAIAIYQAQLYEESQAKTQALKQSYQNLKDTQSQLIQSEKMSSLGQLVAGIAHEINNPVSFIYGNLSPALSYANDLAQLIRLYQEQYPDPPQAIADFTQEADIDYIFSDFPNLLASMKTGATRIRDIVTSLRTFSRLDQATYEAVDLHANIDNALVILQNRLNGRAGNPEIQVIKQYGNLPRVECYGGLLNQVFMNLLVNAIDAIEDRQKAERQKATASSHSSANSTVSSSDTSSALSTKTGSNYSGQITITSAVSPRDKVRISIQDNGMGMTADTQAKIFNPFFTTKPTGVGTGMGLSISYQIVSGDHQGQLACHSTPGEGTEFVVELWRSLSRA